MVGIFALVYMSLTVRQSVSNYCEFSDATWYMHHAAHENITTGVLYL